MSSSFVTQPGHLHILTSLHEAALDDVKRTVEVVCIRPGVSKNGNYYSPAVITAMLPLFEGARAFADHPAPTDRPERSIRDIVGYYKSPRIDSDGALRARLKVSRSADWLWSLIQESIEDGQAGLVGLSIDANAQVAPGLVDGRAVRIVESITRLNSCDIVTRASAGGAVERLLQADNSSWWDEYMPANEQSAQLIDDTISRPGTVQRPIHQGAVPPVQFGPSLGSAVPGGTVITDFIFVSEGDSMTTTTNDQSMTETPSPTVATLQEAIFDLRREREQLECDRQLDKILRESGLPDVIQARLERRFRGTIYEREDLSGVISEEREVLASLTSAGLIRGMGIEKSITVGMNEADKLQKGFDQLFDVYEGDRVPSISGIREAYAIATGDHAVSGVMSQERLREADMTTTSFSFLLGTSMNKKLLKDYQAWPSEWQKFCTVTPIKDFKQQDRVRLGAFGSLSTVAEDSPYTTLSLTDTRAAYTPQKRGNLVTVTRETIVNDDLFAIKQIPGKLAVAAAFTLSEFIYGFLTTTSQIYDGVELFTIGTPHTNSAVTPAIGTTPAGGSLLAASAMQHGVTAMRRQTNMAGKPIGLKPRYLIVPPELEWTAMTLTKSAGAPGTNYNDINPMLGYAEVIVAPQLSSPTGWYLACDPRVIDTVEVGFVGGQINPVLFVQDQPLFGNNFTNDVISYKVRHEYGATVVDYRGFYQGNT